MSVLQFTSGVALEVLDFALGVGDDGVTARGQVSLSNLSVFICELEGLFKSQSLINRPSNRESIHRNLSENSLAIEETFETVTIALQIDSVTFGDLVGQITQDWNA